MLDGCTDPIPQAEARLDDSRRAQVLDGPGHGLEMRGGDSEGARTPVADGLDLKGSARLHAIVLDYIGDDLGGEVRELDFGDSPLCFLVPHETICPRLIL